MGAICPKGSQWGVAFTMQEPTENENGEPQEPINKQCFAVIPHSKVLQLQLNSKVKLKDRVLEIVKFSITPKGMADIKEFTGEKIQVQDGV